MGAEGEVMAKLLTLLALFAVLGLSLAGSLGGDDSSHKAAEQVVPEKATVAPIAADAKDASASSALDENLALMTLRVSHFSTCDEALSECGKDGGCPSGKKCTCLGCNDGSGKKCWSCS